jgi:MerR family transcriptional regulator, thiopeptide resistance regulator
MEYSVEDLSKLAKVSVRTLHYYDEIGLLAPAIRMESGKRCYLQEQFMRLMDIIFFKRLGFSLKKIESMLDLGNRDKRSLMIAKKEFLKKEINRMKGLMKSIDVMLDLSFKGENLNYNQIIKQFENFQKTAKEDKQSFLNEFGTVEDEEAKKLKKMSLKEQTKYFEDVFAKVDMASYSKKMNDCFQKLAEAIEKNKKEDSKEVQNLMKEYYDAVSMIFPMTKKKWIRMGVSIGEDKATYTKYAQLHPKFPEFLAKAIKIFGKSLKE